MEHDPGAMFALPSPHLLPPPRLPASADKAALARGAQLLEHVLADFDIQAEVVEVRPGPVVTLYALALAPGTKASRVVALASDVARSMSAVSARIAVIPGENLIGVELPNAKRETVSLRGLIEAPEFDEHTGCLPLILGKNTAGEAVIADLAPMPHLLVAGTTGSGKSVGLNCMILSLLYRLTPEQCRFIMIDPKMLELSVYDNIPHLLAPVITDPAKAVRALAWAVEQMEDRYRQIASVGARSLETFNDKVRAARAHSQRLGRRVPAGVRADTGQPVYEDEQLDYEVLPQIVVIVDELADLMMTAGKEVEFLIQRLAQKARAAGIHLVMATQHPSSEVVTSTIKASLPTRVAFKVMNHHASRTVIGEAGAEHLLGHGDMLIVLPGEPALRVHGALADVGACEAVANHWRSQASPDYVASVTGDPYLLADWQSGSGAANDEDEKLYGAAKQLVLESRKASTSWLQRQLAVGFNAASHLVERMEREGLVSRPDPVGRREVLSEQLQANAVAPPPRGWWQRTFGG